MSKLRRFILLAVGILTLILAFAFCFQWPWATALWPWSGYYSNLSGLSYFFLAAVAAASATPLIWIGLTGKVGAAAPGALDVAVLHAGISVFLFQSYSADPANSRLLAGAIALAIGVVLDIGIYFWTRHVPDPDPRPMPLPVRLSFVVFAIVLLLVGLACILKMPNILPWEVSVEASVVYGWVFVGASVYFIYALLRPSWHNTAGQLIGFLAYDLFLIVPLIGLFPDVLPERRASLIIYTIVLVYSGLLALYYLFLNRTTRIIGARPIEQKTGFHIA